MRLLFSGISLKLGEKNLITIFEVLFLWKNGSQILSIFMQITKKISIFVTV